jgi:uncharacterized protein (UPF0335 family)
VDNKLHHVLPSKGLFGRERRRVDEGRDRKTVGDSNLSINLLATFAALPSRTFKKRQGMTDTVGIAGNRILSFIERVEQIEEELKALTEGKKEVFSEAKGEGFDVKVLKEILRLRKQDKDERDEQESLLDLYLRAMQNAQTGQAKAA